MAGGGEGPPLAAFIRVVVFLSSVVYYTHAQVYIHVSNARNMMRYINVRTWYLVSQTLR